MLQVEAADAEPGDDGTLEAADAADAQERARKRPRLSQELRYVFLQKPWVRLCLVLVQGKLSSCSAMRMRTYLVC